MSFQINLYNCANCTITTPPPPVAGPFDPVMARAISASQHTVAADSLHRQHIAEEQERRANIRASKENAELAEAIAASKRTNAAYETIAEVEEEELNAAIAASLRDAPVCEEYPDDPF